jgi:hypothetical protein
MHGVCVCWRALHACKITWIVNICTYLKAYICIYLKALHACVLEHHMHVHMDEETVII